MMKRKGKPISTRVDLQEQHFTNKRVCFQSMAGFVKIRVPMEKRAMHQAESNVLDQTRIHLDQYIEMERIACYVIHTGEDYNSMDEFKRGKAIATLIRNTDMLKDISKAELKEHLQNQGNEDFSQKSNRIDWLLTEFSSTFKDPRESRARKLTEQGFDAEDLLYCMIDETKQTFKKGIIVSATVVRVFESNED